LAVGYVVVPTYSRCWGYSRSAVALPPVEE
jgi:hypothetical protein